MRLVRALPSLSGRRGDWVRRAYLTLTAIVAALTLGGIASRVIVQFRDQPAAMHYGFILGSDELQHPIIGRALPVAPASGLVSGDRIVAIDGVALAPAATQYGVARLLRRGDASITIDTRGGDGTVTRHALRRAPELSGPAYYRGGLPHTIYNIIFITNSIVRNLFYFALSLTLFLRRGRDPEAMLLAVGFMIRAFDPGYDAWLTGGDTSDVLNFLQTGFGMMGWWCVLVGMAGFPDGRFVTRWSRIAALIPTTYVLVNLATGMRFFEWGEAVDEVDMPIFAAIALALWMRYRQLEPGIERQQIKVVALGGAALAFGAAMSTVLDQPVIGGSLAPAASFLLNLLADAIHDFAYPLAVLIALLRYRLYDADNAITRSAGYATLTLTLVAVFAFTEQFIQALGQQYLGDSLGSLANGVGAAVSAVMIAPMHHRINEWAERRFRSNLVALRRGLPLLVADLRETVSPEALADATLERVERGVRARHAAILLGRRFLAMRDVAPEQAQHWLADATLGSGTRLEWRRADGGFPIRVPLAADGVGHIGWLLLGARPDGSLFGRDEQRALVEIADPVARGLVVAGERQARLTSRNDADALRDARLASLERQISQLRADLDRR